MQTDTEKSVVFRRIRGRVIPIRVKKETKEVAKGTAAVVAGAAIGVSGGKVFKEAATRSAKFAFRASSVFNDVRSRAFGAGRGAQLAFPEFSRIAARERTARKAMDYALKGEKFAGIIRAGSSALAVGLAGYGIQKIGNAITRKKRKKEVAAASAAGAGAIAAGSFLIGMHGVEGAKHVGRKIAEKAPIFRDAAIRYLKSKYL